MADYNDGLKALITHDFIGRTAERRRFQEILESPRAELLAVYGRRRVGKTFLIENGFKSEIRFKLIGRSDGNMSENLKNFSRALGETTRSAAELQPPSSWSEAFRQLETAINRLRTKKKIVIFFDEFPWLDSAKSGFLAAFEHFWNNWAVNKPNLVCVICGSAAAWMIRKVVSQKGGLYNRVTKKIHLKPFTLAEVESYIKMLGVSLNRHQIAELYLSLGGIPFYYNSIKNGQSAAQIIQSTCFEASAELSDEFQHIFRALFDRHERHAKIVELLSQTHQGINRNTLLKKMGMSSGGWFTETLEELEASGFIEAYIPYGKKSNAALYRIVDEFTLFYLKWMKPVANSKQRSKNNTIDWNQIRNTPAWQAWAGYTFENICWKHIQSIKQELQIGAIQSCHSPWQIASSDTVPEGAQIDLLIDRKDDVINLCEMKFTQTPFVINKAYAQDLLRKMEVFRTHAKVPARCSVVLTIISAMGIEINQHSQQLNPVVLDLESLFSAQFF